MPIEIDWELKDINKLKEDGFQNTASKYSPAFVNALENTNKLAVLYRLKPLLISKYSTALEG